jgi:hypothetical protein
VAEPEAKAAPKPRAKKAVTTAVEPEAEAAAAPPKKTRAKKATPTEEVGS